MPRVFAAPMPCIGRSSLARNRRLTVYDYIPFVYSAGCLGVIGFQIALILGAPWGPITQGGQHPGKLPVYGRIAAGASVFVLIGSAFAITSAAGLWPRWPSWMGWTALAIQSVIALVNWITPSRPERLLWGPITLGMLVLAALVVLGP